MSTRRAGARPPWGGPSLHDFTARHACARLLPVTRVLEHVALDKYLFVRDAYLQRRGYPDNPQADTK